MENTTKTTTTNFRIYGYTNKTNKNWLDKNSKAFGSKSKFLDALITEARKSKMSLTAPTTKIVAKKKATKKVAKAKKVSKVVSTKK